jgi:hypothetical protein
MANCERMVSLVVKDTARLFDFAPKLSFFPNDTEFQRFMIHYKSSQNKRERVSIKPIF